MAEEQYILLVDDDVDDLMLLREAIEELDNVIISECRDGRSALNFLREKQKKNHLPCLIVLDINMPLLDGKELLAIIKSDPDLKKLPVIVFTTSSNKEDINYCAQFDVQLLTKPFNVNKLKEMAKKMISYCQV